jgi:nitroreductase
VRVAICQRVVRGASVVPDGRIRRFVAAAFVKPFSVAPVELDIAIRRRRMCRNFQTRPVPRETVDRLLEGARRAPSAGHAQGWAFVVLEGPDETTRFWATDADPAWLAHPDHPGVLHAPVIILPFCNRHAYLARYRAPDKVTAGLAEEADWPAPYWLIDTAFATMLLLLEAVDEGLGALLFRLHGDPSRLRSAFGVPDGWDPIGAVALGWPAPDASPLTPRPLRPFAEVVHRGGW